MHKRSHRMASPSQSPREMNAGRSSPSLSGRDHCIASTSNLNLRKISSGKKETCCYAKLRIKKQAAIWIYIYIARTADVLLYLGNMSYRLASHWSLLHDLQLPYSEMRCILNSRLVVLLPFKVSTTNFPFNFLKDGITELSFANGEWPILPSNDLDRAHSSPSMSHVPSIILPYYLGNTTRVVHWNNSTTTGRYLYAVYPHWVIYDLLSI